MATLKDLDKWTKTLNRFGANVSKGASNYPGKETRVHLEFFTDTNKYSINAVERKNGHSYLGCGASCRKPRAGEEQHRGRDLADGDLSHETWVRILADIVSYEMVNLHVTKTTPVHSVSDQPSLGEQS